MYFSSYMIIVLASLLLRCVTPLSARYKPLDNTNQHARFLQRRLGSQMLPSSHFGHVDLAAAYDYVIIGGGTAGLTLARRLAASHTVAVIEAGSFYEVDNGNFTDLPADASYYLGKDPVFVNPLVDWRQQTTPQAGFNGASVLYPQGRTLGGGSTRNFMWYQRGSTGSYQMWADAVGNQSYTFTNWLPFFKKSVKFTPPNTGTRPTNSTPMYDAAAFTNSGGPLQVSYPNFASPAASWISLGLNAIGLKELPGMSSGNLLGWIWVTDTLDPTSQTRSTSESSFLREALQLNENLIVYRSTLGKKIVFDSNNKATGVMVETAGVGSGSVSYTINATMEVIVSSGSFRSPQMLMVSGIGPAQTLRSQDIPVIADRPGVGQGMWDHIFFGPTYEVKTVTHSWLGNPAFNAEQTQEYISSRNGILTNVGGDLLAFEKLPKGAITNSTRADLDNTFSDDWPDIEILSLDAYTGILNDFVFGAPDLKNYTAVCITLVAPFSRGNISITSNDTNIHPIVNPNWLTDPRDMEVAIAGFKRARDIFQSSVVQPILAGSESFPGPSVQTDAQIEQMIRSSSDTIHHAAGTNRMGRNNDSMAVVDTSARVIGVHGLRVVDASVFPLLPPGHPQATVYALAEKIACDILTTC